MIKYFIILNIASIIISCAANHQENNEKANLIKKTADEFLITDTTSLSCKICLLKDSIEKINSKIISYTFENKDITSLENDKLKLDSSLLKMKTKLKNESHDFVYLDYAETAALQQCLTEYPFNDVSDSVERENYFLQYVSYSNYNYTQLPTIFIEIDISDLKKVDDFYIVKVKGKNVKVKINRFDEYWKKVKETHQASFLHLEAKKNGGSMKICGRNVSQLSKIESLMFQKHSEKCNDDIITYQKIDNEDFNDVRRLNHHLEKIRVYIDNDTVYRKLYEDFINAQFNR